jgi:hypothetical protein
VPEPVAMSLFDLTLIVLRDSVISPFYTTYPGNGENMTVSELIRNWTAEERKQHTNLIMECLEREQHLNDLKRKIEIFEKGMANDLDQLLSDLSQLTKIVNQIFDHLENIYLCLAKAQGNA